MPTDGFLTISYRSSVKIARQYLLRGLTCAAGKYARGRLIDLGCGDKPYEPLFRPYVSSYFGVDFSTTFLDHATAHTRVDRWADCTATGLPGGTFDTVLCTQVLEHVKDPAALVAEAGRLLAPGGMCIMTAPMLWGLHGEPADFFRFTKFGLISLFERHGFQVLEVTPLEGAYAALKQMELIALDQRLPRGGVLGTVIRRAVNLIRIPLKNFLALKLDQVYANERLCLNYLIVGKKRSANTF